MVFFLFLVGTMEACIHRRAKGGKTIRQNRVLRSVAATALHLLFAAAVPAAQANAAREDIFIEVIDVEYGSAVLLTLEDEHYLFDVGSTDSREKLLQTLNERFVTRLQAVFLTHTHPDHAGALLHLVSRIPVATIFWNERLPDDEDLVSELDAVQERVPLQVLTPGQSMRLSKTVHLSVLASTYRGADLNNQSLVFGISRKGNHLLIPGDAGEARQLNLIEHEAEFLGKTDWLLWPHHGDRLAEPFIDALGRVKHCVVSVGKNPWGMPAPSLESQAAELCGSMFRTDREGSLRFRVGRGIFTVNAER